MRSLQALSRFTRRGDISIRGAKKKLHPVSIYSSCVHSSLRSQMRVGFTWGLSSPLLVFARLPSVGPSVESSSEF